MLGPAQAQMVAPAQVVAPADRKSEVVRPATGITLVEAHPPRGGEAVAATAEAVGQELACWTGMLLRWRTLTISSYVSSSMSTLVTVSSTSPKIIFKCWSYACTENAPHESDVFLFPQNSPAQEQEGEVPALPVCRNAAHGWPHNMPAQRPSPQRITAGDGNSAETRSSTPS